MAQKGPTKTTSIRAEPELIQDFQRAMEARGSSQNAAVVGFMREQVLIWQRDLTAAADDMPAAA